jgi:hypothetical protein
MKECLSSLIHRDTGAMDPSRSIHFLPHFWSTCPTICRLTSPRSHAPVVECLLFPVRCLLLLRALREGTVHPAKTAFSVSSHLAVVICFNPRADLQSSASRQNMSPHGALLRIALDAGPTLRVGKASPPRTHAATAIASDSRLRENRVSCAETACNYLVNHETATFLLEYSWT